MAMQSGAFAASACACRQRLLLPPTPNAAVIPSGAEESPRTPPYDTAEWAWWYSRSILGCARRDGRDEIMATFNFQFSASIYLTQKN
jgi:hypothetical protein